MKLVLFFSLAAALLAGCDQAPTAESPDDSGIQTPSLAAVSITDNLSVPLSLTVFIPCANGGSGEDVTLTGTLHILVHLTINSGHFTFYEHFQPQGISGNGSLTGDKYQGTGVTQDMTTAGVVGSTFTLVNNFRMIGQGPGNNFLVHENLHVTVNANGTLTTFVDNLSIECS